MKSDYRGMTHAMLDKQYRPTAAIADAAQLIAHFDAVSAAYRNSSAGILDARYGATNDEIADIFLPARAGASAPIHVFIHGGYWYQFGKQEWSFIARGLCAQGAIVVVPKYALCPQVTLSEIVRQMRTLVRWIYRKCGQWGGDRERIFVSGHSAGGHLALMLLRTPWLDSYGLPENVIKGVISVSGVFDLTPLRLTFLQDLLHLTEREVSQLSPAMNVTRLPAPAVFAAGSEETDEFRRQSAAMHAAHHAIGSETEQILLAERNHLTVLYELSESPGILCRMAARQMNL